MMDVPRVLVNLMYVFLKGHRTVIVQVATPYWWGMCAETPAFDM